MIHSPQCLRKHIFVLIGNLVTLGPILGCTGGEIVTADAISRAKQRWTSAGIHDYEIEWSVRGPNNAHYFVTVRRGEVQKVESYQSEGRKFELRPGEPRFFGVDGLFLTISDELAQLKTDRPFGQAKGTKVVMRFDCDAKLGYPLWYRRDVLGTPQAIAIDVIRLESSKNPPN
jgi:hypothetical protein